MSVEYRYAAVPPSIAKVTPRAAKGVSPLTTIAGYAALYNVETVIAGFFRERLAPGAFRDAVRRDDVRALFNHNVDRVLGRTASGTLRLSEDTTGLRYEIDLNHADPFALSVAAMIARRDVSGSSFGFLLSEEDERWEYPKGSKLPLRTIFRVELTDVSPVTYPAYPTTTVSARGFRS